jgi:hypothetical protein
VRKATAALPALLRRDLARFSVLDGSLQRFEVMLAIVCEPGSTRFPVLALPDLLGALRPSPRALEALKHGIEVLLAAALAGAS